MCLGPPETTGSCADPWIVLRIFHLQSYTFGRLFVTILKPPIFVAEIPPWEIFNCFIVSTGFSLANIGQRFDDGIAHSRIETAWPCLQVRIIWFFPAPRLLVWNKKGRRGQVYTTQWNTYLERAHWLPGSSSKKGLIIENLSKRSEEIRKHYDYSGAW